MTDTTAGTVRAVTPASARPMSMPTPTRPLDRGDSVGDPIERPVDVAAVLTDLVDHLDADRRTNIGFPSTFDLNIEPLLPLFTRVLNNVGDPFLESAFPANTKHLERQVLDWFANLLRAPARWWGVCTSGGTEGIEYGLLHARSRHKGGVVMHSAAAHYSVAKVAAKLAMPTAGINSHPSGQMDYGHLAMVVRAHRRRPVIVVATVGTTMTEAIDDVATIRTILADHRITRAYVHGDEALSGMHLAVLPPAQRPAFDLADGIDSISISAHKFLGCPFPAGVYLAAEPAAAGLRVDYIATADTTLAGSRSGHAPLLMWYAINTYGIDGLRHRADQARRTAAYAVDKLQAIGWPAWRYPHALTVVLDAPPTQIRTRWRLATSGPVSHLITMPGITVAQVDELVAEVEAHVMRTARGGRE